MGYRIQTSRQRAGDHYWAYRLIDDAGNVVHDSGYSYYEEQQAVHDAHQKILRLEDADNPEWKDVD